MARFPGPLIFSQSVFLFWEQIFLLHRREGEKAEPEESARPTLCLCGRDWDVEQTVSSQELHLLATQHRSPRIGELPPGTGLIPASVVRGEPRWRHRWQTKPVRSRLLRLAILAAMLFLQKLSGSAMLIFEAQRVALWKNLRRLLSQTSATGMTITLRTETKSLINHLPLQAIDSSMALLI